MQESPCLKGNGAAIAVFTADECGADRRAGSETVAARCHSGYTSGGTIGAEVIAPELVANLLVSPSPETAQHPEVHHGYLGQIVRFREGTA